MHPAPRRKRARPLVLLLCAALAGCALADPPALEVTPSYTPATQVEEPPPPPVVEIPTLLPLPGQLKPLPVTTAGRPPSKRPRDPQASITQAQAAARQEPTPEGYLNSMQVYTFVPGALYQLYTAPEHVTDIALQPGETLVAKAAGDTVRWIVGDTTSGTGETQQVHVLVKPIQAGLQTNLVITTDRRTYHLECHSTDGTYLAAVSWRYPQDELQRLTRQAAAQQARQAPVIAPALDATTLRFAYKLESKDPPRWMPLQVFDDGQKTYIQLPPTLATTEAPALFLKSQEGTTQLVNYRVKANWYIVDRLFDEAELRVGEKHPAVVRIVRQGR
ncbi:MAG: P-type conjugative transfer protein TrbG [Candidatus Tectimicrobiota bacterium]